ncbi:MAG: YqcC family protein [Gammaproteobacteria bacterium]|nr:YqcC family protein [Gammaproteobacteria bacterium]
MTKRVSIAAQTLDILEQLEAELKAAKLWQAKPPSVQALQSSAPFASDTLDFHQWLQFILIPTLNNLIDQRAALPNAIAISPMAVEVWRGQLREHRQIILQLKALDELLDGHHARH